MPTKVLILAANPANKDHLQYLEKEARDIRLVFEQSRNASSFQVDYRGAVRFQDLLDRLTDFQPEIIHFCGHGGEGGIMLEKDDGSAQLVDTQTLDRLFQIIIRYVKVKIVFLNACYTEEQAAAIGKYVPYVVGMRTALLDTAGPEFAAAFYRSLAKDLHEDDAYQLACLALEIAVGRQSHVPFIKKNLPSQPPTAAPVAAALATPQPTGPNPAAGAVAGPLPAQTAPRLLPFELLQPEMLDLREQCEACQDLFLTRSGLIGLALPAQAQSKVFESFPSRLKRDWRKFNEHAPTLFFSARFAPDNYLQKKILRDAIEGLQYSDQLITIWVENAASFSQFWEKACDECRCSPAGRHLVMLVYAERGARLPGTIFWLEPPALKPSHLHEWMKAILKYLQGDEDLADEFTPLLIRRCKDERDAFSFDLAYSLMDELRPFLCDLDSFVRFWHAQV